MDESLLHDDFFVLLAFFPSCESCFEFKQVCVQNCCFEVFVDSDFDFELAITPVDKVTSHFGEDHAFDGVESSCFV